MDDVAFELGLLKADRSSYISLLPIPILRLIKNYLKECSHMEYIIRNNECNYDVYISSKPDLDDFFEYIKSFPLDSRGNLTNGIYWMVEYIFAGKGKIFDKEDEINKLVNNRHLLFNMLSENKKYSLKIQHTYTRYKNDLHTSNWNNG